MTPFQLEELSLPHERQLVGSSLFVHNGSKILTTKITNSAQFKKFIKESAKHRFDWRPGPNKISITRYAMLNSENQVQALGLMRFPLDSTTELEGGNIIVEVPVTMRDQGLGSMCLALMLFEAVRAGLRRVFVTCAAADGAARRMIEKNRGELQEIIKVPSLSDREVARYWIRVT